MQNRPLRTIIVDDEEKAIKNLEALLKEFPQVQVVDKSSDPEKALGKIMLQKPDLLFMDIQMPEQNGFEIVQEVYRSGLKPDVIFVTAHNEYAITAIRYAAFDYLLKPVNHEELRLSLDRLLEKQNRLDKDERMQLLIKKMTKHKIKFTDTAGFMLIKPEDIIYIKADWNYSEIWFDKEKKELVTMNIGSVEELLPNDVFFRINRSTIININYLSKVIRKNMTAILVKDGQEYTVKIPLLKIRNLEKFLG